MHLDLASIALLGASQLVTAAILVVLRLPGEDGVPDAAPRRWAAALLLGAFGWALFALPLQPAPWVLMLACNALLSRELGRLGASPHRAGLLVACAGIGGLALVLLYALNLADASRRVFALAVLALYALPAWQLRPALRRGGPRTMRAMLALLLLAAVVPAGLLWQPQATAWAAALALAPVLLSFGFLPLHTDVRRRSHRPLAHVDPLTGALNRRGIVHQSHRLFASSMRHGRGLALLLVQIDHFARLGSIFGPAAERMFLPPVHACLEQLVRAEDVVGRSAADTFVVLLPESDPAGAADAAERVRDAVRRLRIDTPRRVMRMTASIGVATMMPGDRDLQPMLRRAATALAVARREGCNRVTTRAPRFRATRGNAPPHRPGREAR